LLDARKEDTKRCFIYKHWSRVVWRTWLELWPYLNFSRLQPPLSYKVAAPCQWRPFQRICYIAALSLSRHDMTDPGGAQERKSEEIRREHMRLAKDSVLPVQGEREEAHGATSWTMSFAMRATLHHPKSHQSPWVMWANSRILSSFTCCQYLPKKLIQDFDPSLTPTKLWHGKAM
jgi:hypothetical protein